MNKKGENWTNPTSNHNALVVLSYFDSSCGVRVFFDRIQLLYPLRFSSIVKILKNLFSTYHQRLLHWYYPFLKYGFLVDAVSFWPFFIFLVRFTRNSFTLCRTVLYNLMFVSFRNIFFETLGMHSVLLTVTLQFRKLFLVVFYIGLACLQYDQADNYFTVCDTT